MARSNATQAMTLECVKCLRGPRTSQMPSSGSIQCDSRNLSSANCTFQAAGSGSSPLIRARCSVSITSPYTSSWNCRRCRVAHAHRRGALVAGQPAHLVLVEAAHAGHAVQNLQILRRARHRAQQPFAPTGRLLDVAGEQQGIQREGRIAQPAVAVVPIAHPARLFRQRGRGSRDDASGRFVRERLQRDEGSDHRPAPAALDRAALGPVMPCGLGLARAPRSRRSAAASVECEGR